MFYALRNDMYPIETKDQVKVASKFFNDNLTKFSPSDRVEIAINMEKRAEQLNMDLDLPWINNYSRMLKKEASYSPEFEQNMKARKDLCSTYNITVKIGDSMIKAAELVDKMIIEKPTTQPLAMVAAINSFDKLASLESHYDTRLMDSIYTVFGSTQDSNYDIVKLACGTDCKTLQKASKNKKFMKKMSSWMGDTMASKFTSNPVDTFNSLMGPEQELLVEKIAEVLSECEECGSRVSLDDDIDPKECSNCGGKMELKEV